MPDIHVAAMLDDVQHSRIIPVPAPRLMGITLAADSSSAVPSYTLQSSGKT